MSPVMPFGKYRSVALAEIPSSYLRWAIRECRLSTGLVTGVRAEIERRGITLPPEPPPPPRLCRDHPAAGIVAYWMTMRDGRRMIRGECRECGRSVGSLPQAEPFISQANDGSDPTALLRVMILAEELGVTVTRRGTDIDLSPYANTTPELRALARQARHSLVPMLPSGGTA